MKSIILFIVSVFSIQVSAQQLTQTISGKVSDQITREGLIGANIKLQNIEPLLGATSYYDGNFIIQNVPLGRHTIEVTYIGYESVTIPEIQVTSGKGVQLQIQLKESFAQLEGIVITADIDKSKPMNETAVVSARAFTVEETRRYAGGFDDPGRLVSAFAGVTSNNLSDNGIVIRGNAPKGVQWRVEGLEIPNPSHFAGASVSGGGFFTLLSGQMLSNSDFYTGAFPAEYGNAMAGVFDINLRTGNSYKREHTFQAGLLGLDFASEGPFKEGKKATYLFNYRYSTFGLILPLLPEESNALKYQDLSYKLHFPTKIGTFELWGLGGLDKSYTRHELEADSSLWETTNDFSKNDFGFDLGTAGLTHKLVFGKDMKTFIQSTAAVSVNDAYYNEDWLHPNGNDLYNDKYIDQNYKTYTASTQLNHKFSNRFNIRSGLTANRLSYTVEIDNALNHYEPVTRVAEEDGVSNRYQAFAQAQVSLSPELTLNAGLHSQYFEILKDATIEPRVGLQWNYADDQSLSIGYGNHSRMEDLKIYFVVDANGNSVNKDLKITRANHLVLGWDKQINPFTRFKLEPYVQHLYRVPVIADSTYSMLNFEQDWYFNGELESTGEGLNYGIDITLERFLNHDFYYLVTASLFKSRYMDGSSNWHNTRWDRGYALDFLWGKEWNWSKARMFGFNTRLNLMGGKRMSPLDESASLIAQEPVYDESRPFIDQEPMSYYLDMTLTLRKNKPTYSTIWALQVKNMLGSPNYEVVYNYQTNEIEENAFSIVIPNLSWKIEF